MKHIILLAALAIGAHAQTYVTVQGPIPTANGSGWSGTIFYSWVGQTCGSTFIAPDRKSVRVNDGVIQGTISLLAGCPSPYLIEYSGASTGRASWTIPAGMSSPTTIALIQSNYIPNPFYQFSPLVLTVPPGDPAKRCWGKNEAGTAWEWITCGSGGGSGGTDFIWGLGTGTLSNQLDLQAALDAKASLSHSHLISDTAGLQGALNAKEPALPSGSSAQYFKGDKTLGTLDIAAIAGLTTALAGKASTAHAATHGLGQTDPLTLDQSQISGLSAALAAKQGLITFGDGFVSVGSSPAIDWSVVPRWSTGSGPPNYAVPAGSEIYRDQVTGFLYMANGTTSWDLIYKAGMLLQAADFPAPTATALGGVKRNTGNPGEFVSGVGSDGSLLYGTPTGGGGGGSGIGTFYGGGPVATIALGSRAFAPQGATFVAQNTTNWLRVAQRMPNACTAKNLRVNLAVAQGAGGSEQVWLYAGATTPTATALTCSVSSGSLECQNLSDTVPVAAGDYFYMADTNGSSVANSYINFSWQCQ